MKKWTWLTAAVVPLLMLLAAGKAKAGHGCGSHHGCGYVSSGCGHDMDDDDCDDCDDDDCDDDDGCGHRARGCYHAEYRGCAPVAAGCNHEARRGCFPQVQVGCHAAEYAPAAPAPDGAQPTAPPSQEAPPPAPQGAAARPYDDGTVIISYERPQRKRGILSFLFGR